MNLPPALSACIAAVSLGSATPADRLAQVDEAGVLRWQDDGSEVALFGVNYYPPFHWNFRDIRALGLSHEKVIEQDLAHFSRLGLDVLRLHCFDREISDREGNLLENEHLRLLDFLIAGAKARGIHTVLTPIAWWGVPGESPGFSTAFTMQQMTTDPAARAAQRNYLGQFVRHVNPFTGMACKDDPAVLCFELINEPHYPEGTTDAEVTGYINALADAVRASGSRKPVFYNAWAGRQAAVRDARVEGATFGWYPTGLVAGRTLARNFLPAVDHYGGGSWNPPMHADEFRKKAKMVYEFDAADIGGSHIYPAMARAFRSGGAQVATQFQYDPLPLAPCNAGWQTHYLNLAFAPHKAVSFLIAAEAFRRLPRCGDHGEYPRSARFGPFRVSHEEDLSEMVTESEFLHSNTTRTVPPSPQRLTRIAGCGSSPVVDYPGTGAWFLDRVDDGAWRLEVYPDAVWVDDPSGRDSLDREVSRVYWREWPMELRLPDLGAGFTADPLDQGNGFRPVVDVRTLRVRPGVYLLRRSGVTARPAPACEFIAPPSSARPPVVRHEPRVEWLEGTPLTLAFTVATAAEPEEVMLEFAGSELPLRRDGAYQFSAAIPGDWLKPGEAGYRLRLRTGGGTLAFPQDRPQWSLRLAARGSPVTLFEAGRHWMRGGGVEAQQNVVDGMEPGRRATRLGVVAFGPEPSAASFRNEVSEELDPRREDLAGRRTLCLRVRSRETATTAAEVVLIERDGAAWGTNVPLATDWREVRVPLGSLRCFAHWEGVPAGRGGRDDRLRPDNLAAVNVCFGAWLYPGHAAEPHTIEIERITIE